jgi:hypothetical protein
MEAHSADAQLIQNALQRRQLCRNLFSVLCFELKILASNKYAQVSLVGNSANHEILPLLESAETSSRNSREYWKGCSEDERHSWKACLEDISYAWPLVWLDDGHRYRLVLYAGISLLQLFFYARVPYLFGSVVEGVLEPEIWNLLTELLLCVFLRDYICTRLRSWIWQPYALRSQQLTAERTQDKIFDSPGKHSTWSSGGFLSDFNKGGSPNTCLEKVLFT